MGIAPVTRPMSISRWAAGLGLVMVLGALGVSALAVWKLRQSATDAARVQLDHVTLALSSHAAQTLASATLVLDGIAQSVADERIADADALRARLGTESFHRTLRARVAGAPAVEVAVIADDRGNVINYSRVYPPKPINVMDREYFTVYSGATPPRGAWVSAPVPNRTNGKWTFYIGRRIDAADGRFLGLLVVGLTSEYFAQFYEALALGASTDLRLYRDDLTLLATAPERGELLGRRAVSGGAWQIIVQHKLRQGSVELASPRGLDPQDAAPRMVAARAVPALPLVVAVAQKSDAYLADWWRAAWSIGVVASLSALAILLAFAALVHVLRRREADMRHTEVLRRQAESANRAKTEFLATMSHELRTPLTGVLGTAEMLTLTPLSDEQRGLVDTLGRSSRALLEIIDEILDFARIESGAARIVRAPFDAGHLLSEVVDLFRAQAQASGLALALEAGSDTARWVSGDVGRVRQVLINLLSNALKFTPRGGVRLGVKQLDAVAEQGPGLRFTVRDTGIGISPALREQLFLPFVQADGSPARRFGGAGLGLAISQRLCELMGGRIGVDAPPEGGSLFWIELPLPPAEAAPSAPATSTPELATRGGAGVRVLLVEDNEVNALVIQAQLAQLGCRCDVASGGEQALQRLASEHYDMVFMDCMMPGIDGYEVTRRVRQREQASGAGHVPIVALTANAASESPSLSRVAGMDDHMSKPCSIESLAAAVRRWAVRPAANA